MRQAHSAPSRHDQPTACARTRQVGLNYICATAERFFAVSAVLNAMVAALPEQPSTRLLKHIIRCYLRLSDNTRAREALRQCLPQLLRDPGFTVCLKDDLQTRQCAPHSPQVLRGRLHDPPRLGRRARRNGLPNHGPAEICACALPMMCDAASSGRRSLCRNGLPQREIEVAESEPQRRPAARRPGPRLHHGRWQPILRTSLRARWLAQLLVNVGLQHGDPAFSHIMEATGIQA